MIRDILGAVGEADTAICTANSDLPGGMTPLDFPEQLVRGLTGEEIERIVDRETLQASAADVILAAAP